MSPQDTPSRPATPGKSAARKRRSRAAAQAVSTPDTAVDTTFDTAAITTERDETDTSDLWDWDTSTSPDNPAYDPLNLLLRYAKVTDKPEGMGDAETVVAYHTHDNAFYFEIQNRGGYVRTALWNGTKIESVLHGTIECTGLGDSYGINSDDRTVDSDSSSGINPTFDLLFTAAESGARKIRRTTSDIEMSETNKSAAWLSQLGVTQHARNRAVREKIPDLVRAVITTKRIKHAQQQHITLSDSGPVFIGGKLHWAAPGGSRIGAPRGCATGSVIGPDGPLDNMRVSIGSEIGLTKEISLPDAPPTVEEGVSGLDALALYLDGYQDRGTTSILVGQVIASLLAGYQMEDPDANDVGVATVSTIIGPTQSGKTWYALALMRAFAPKFRSEMAPFDMRVSPGNSADGNTSASGIRSKLEHLAGCTFLLDEAMKDADSEPRQHAALAKVHASIAGATVGGGAAQARATNGQVTSAGSLKVYCSSIITQEVIGPVARMAEHSAYNRIAVVWWDEEKRCDEETYRRLNSITHHRTANAGLRAVLTVLLRNPDMMLTGYYEAVSYLRDNGIPDRVAKNYGRCVMGLYALDATYDSYGKRTTYFTDSLSLVLETVQRFVSHGQDGDDVRAGHSVEAATREGLRSLFHTGRLFIASPPDPADGPEIAAVPQEPTGLPSGYPVEDVGWSADREGTWKPARSDARQLGAFHAKLPGTPGRSPAFPYRVDITTMAFEGMHEALNEWAKRKDVRQCSRNERIQALVKVGALVEPSGKGGRNPYRLDFLWIFGITYEQHLEAVTAAGSESETDNG